MKERDYLDPYEKETTDRGLREDSNVESRAWDYLRGKPNEDYLRDLPEEGYWEEEDRERMPWEKGALPEAEDERPHKTRKKHHYLRNFLIFLLLLAGSIAFLMSDFFALSNVRVEGNQRYSTEEIQEKAGLVNGTNLFRVKKKEAEEALLQDPYIAEVSIERDFPKDLLVQIKEREELAYLKSDKKYFIVDEEAYLLRKTEKAPVLCEIKGLKPTKKEEGSPLEAEEEAALVAELEILRIAKKEGFTPQSIQEKEGEFRLFLSKELLVRGTAERMAKHLENGNIMLTIEDLEERGISRGTIRLDNEDYCSFSPKVE